MEFKGSGFKYFFNNESKTIEEIKELVDNNTTVSVKGLEVHYFSPKKELNKTEKLLKEAEQHQKQNGGRVESEFPYDTPQNLKSIGIPLGHNGTDILSVFIDKKEGSPTEKDTDFWNSIEKSVKKYQDNFCSAETNLKGKYVTYVYEGVKETEGKLDYSEINLQILDLMAERFTANKHKYPKGNMKKPLDKDSLVWAAFRHIRKMLQPIENDPENFKEHLTAVLCNMSMILDQENLK